MKQDSQVKKSLHGCLTNMVYAVGPTIVYKEVVVYFYPEVQEI